MGGSWYQKWAGFDNNQIWVWQTKRALRALRSRKRALRSRNALTELQQVLTGVDARQLIGTLLRTPPLRYQFLLACQVEAAAAADYCACVRGSDRKCRVERSPLRMRGRVNVDALNAWSRVCRCYPAGKNIA